METVAFLLPTAALGIVYIKEYFFRKPLGIRSGAMHVKNKQGLMLIILGYLTPVTVADMYTAESFPTIRIALIFGMVLYIIFNDPVDRYIIHT